MEQNDKIKINYLKKSFGKWVVAPSDLDSRLTADLKKMTASVDTRCLYTTTDMWTTNRDHLQISLQNFKQIFYHSRNYQKIYIIPIWFSDNFMVNRSYLLSLDLINFRDHKNVIPSFYFTVLHFNIYIKGTYIQYFVGS